MQDSIPTSSCLTQDSRDSPCDSPVSSSTPLPPCQVCGGKSSGFHYGANTCESCKGFYRRCLTRKTPFRCSTNGQCEISANKRNMCAKCRLSRCQAANMSKEGIKTGRYTHEKRTQNIKQVKQLQGEPMDDEDMYFGKPVAKPSTDYDKLKEDFNSDIESFVDEISEKIKNSGIPYHIDNERHIHKKVDQFMENYTLQIQIFGQLPPLTREEYKAFYKATGIDIDDRKKLVEFFTSKVEESIKKLIKFAKVLPGFAQLTTSDQITLIKTTYFEMKMFLASARVDIERRCFVMDDDTVVHQADMLRIFPEQGYVEAVFNLMGQIKQLNLSVVETTLVVGVVLFSKDRCILENPEQTESYQTRYLNALEYLLKKSDSNKKNIFGKIVSCLYRLRELDIIRIKAEETFTLDWQGQVNFPPIYHEMRQTSTDL